MSDLLGSARTAFSDRYVIERQLGRGGMATVYLARDLRYGRAVAVKVMHETLSSALGPARFLREIDIAAKLQHPHILPLFDSGEADGRLYYVAPFVEGESLRDRLRREKLLPLDDAVHIATEVASALTYAHGRGIIHRDIKPENILLSGGHAIVADFGIARAVSESSELTGCNVVLGTPLYMSPEQASADVALDARSDLYSLGCVVYEMVAGVLPFDGPSASAIMGRRLVEDPTPLRRLRPRVPAHLDRAVMIALAPMAADRFSTVAEFANALQSHILEAGGPSAPQSLRPAPPEAVPVGAQSAARDPGLGSLVSRMCDRWKQVNAFDACFRESQLRHPGRPQFYVVHGDEGEAHESLVERLVATRVSHFAGELAGDERGHVLHWKVPWPDGDALDLRQRDLAIALFREVAPGHMGTELSAAALTQLCGRSLSPIAVIEHELRAAWWDDVTDELLRWYVRSFWGPIRAGGRRPLILVFLKVVYPPKRVAFGLGAWLRWRRIDKSDLQRRIEGVFGATDAPCPVSMLSELSPVTVEDVKSWFNQYGIYSTEQRRFAAAEAIFRSAAARSMAEVEQALEDIHHSFVREMASRGPANHG